MTMTAALVTTTTGLETHLHLEPPGMFFYISPLSYSTNNFLQIDYTYRMGMGGLQGAAMEEGQ